MNMKFWWTQIRDLRASKELAEYEARNLRKMRDNAREYSDELNKELREKSQIVQKMDEEIVGLHERCAARDATVVRLQDSLVASETRNNELKEHIKVARQDADDESFSLNYALNESKELNRALEEENKDLGRQLELLRALLAQVRLNTNLPARRK